MTTLLTTWHGSMTAIARGRDSDLPHAFRRKALGMSVRGRILALTAIVAAGTPVSPRRLAGQGIPVACGTLIREHGIAAKFYPGGSVGQRVFEQLPGVRKALGVGELESPDQPPVHEHILDSLWRHDSVAVEWDLALLAGTTQYADAYFAGIAGGEYARLSGKARPMLDVLLTGSTPRLRGQGLAAIHELATPTERSWTFLFACDAMWQLGALTADTVYQRLWRAEPFVRNLGPAADVLTQATRLLSGRERRAIIQFIPTVVHDLQPIDTFPPVGPRP